MIQAFIRTQNLQGCFQRLDKVFGILEHDPRFTASMTPAAVRSEFWGKRQSVIGSGNSTPVEQCEYTGDYLFNLQLTDEQIGILPKNDTPNFWLQYDGELDESGEPLLIPTFMVENRDIDGLRLGTYHEQTICVQGT